MDGMFLQTNGIFGKLFNLTSGLYIQTNGFAIERFFRNLINVFRRALHILFQEILVVLQISHSS